MKDILLQMPADFLIKVKSGEDFPVDESTRLMAEAYLPGVSWLESAPVFSPGVEVSLKESAKPQFRNLGRYLLLEDQWNGQIPLDLWHLLYSVSRRHFLKHDLYSVHSASAGTENHALMVGHSGVGKTSVTMQMVERYGWKIFSGNKTVMDLADGSMQAVAGTKSITTRTADLSRYTNLPEPQLGYGDRSAHQLDSKRYDSRSRVPVSEIFLPRLNDGVFEAQEVEGLSAVHLLYPYFMDTVSADTVLCQGQAVYKGTPPQGTEEKLAQQLSRTLPSVSVYKVAGSMDFVTETIARLHKS